MVELSKRRGISTVVGGLIFLVLMTSAFSTFYIAFDVQKDTINTQRDISKDIVEKTQEQFVISAGTDPVDNNRLGIQVKNQGPNPVEVANIWIVNKSQLNEPAQRHNVNYEDIFIPSGYGAPILENTPLYLNPVLYGNDYTVKVVSTLGSVKSVPVTASGSTNLLAEMFTIPPDVRQGENVTIALRVTNIGDTILNDVEPENDPPITNPSTDIDTSEFISPSPVSLEPTESTIFTWHFKLKNTASIGTKIIFTNIAKGTDSATGFNYVSNTASDKIIIRDPQGGVGGGEEEIIKDELYGRPQIFMVFPNPSGVDNDVNSRGYWGVMVANPTNQPMDVSKIVIAVVSPRASSDDKIFAPVCRSGGTAPFDPIAVTPFTVTIDWDCPKSNQLVWTDTANPVTVQPRSVHPFIVKIGTQSLDSGNFDTGNILINAMVFTDLGQFGKTGYGSTMQKEDIAMPNVFLSKVSSQSTAANLGNMLGNITRITEGTPVVFNATLVDMSDDDDYGINAGTKLIINLPKEWAFSHIASSTDFTMQPVQIYPDGSTQIVGVLDSHIDQPNEARVIKFYATAPAVTSAKMYVMHILADGTATGSAGGGVFSIGPLAEEVLQVCPTTGCP